MDDPLERANQRIAALRADLSAKIRATKEYEAKVATLQRSLQDKEAEFERYKVQMQQSSASEQTQLEQQWHEIESVQQQLVEQEQGVENERATIEQQRQEVRDERTRMEEEMRAVREEMRAVRDERDTVDQRNLATAAEYKATLAAMQTAQASLAASYSASLFKLENDLQAKDAELLQRASTIELLESRVADAKEVLAQRERAWDNERRVMANERAADRAQLLDTQAKLQRSYLELEQQTAAKLSSVESEAKLSLEQVQVLSKWQQTRAELESTNKQLSERVAALTVETSQSAQVLASVRENAERENAALKQQLQALQEERDKLLQSLKQKKAALKVYHDEIEAQAARSRQAKLEEEMAAAKKAKQTGLSSFTSNLSSLFGHKDDKEKNGSASSSSTSSTTSAAPSPRSTIAAATPRNSKPTSLSSEAFLDVEEEMAVALTERVSKLTEEKVKLQDEINALRLQLEQEQYLSAFFRQQIPEEREKDRDVSKRDKVLLGPERSKYLLEQTIKTSKQLEADLRTCEAELKRAKSQLEVRKQSIAELEAKVAQLTSGAANGNGGAAGGASRLSLTASLTPVRHRPSSTASSVSTPTKFDSAFLTTTGGGGGVAPP